MKEQRLFWKQNTFADLSVASEIWRDYRCKNGCEGCWYSKLPVISSIQLQMEVGAKLLAFFLTWYWWCRFI